MRARALLLVVLLLPSCSSLPGLDAPKFTLSPRMYIAEQTGEASMQSIVGTNVVDNPAQKMHELGQSGTDEDWGIVARLGDGFSGFEAEYRNVENHDTRTGVTSSAFGRIPHDTVVNAVLEMDSWRLAYFGEVLQHSFPLREEDSIRVRLAGAVALVQRDGTFAVKEDGDTGLSQEVNLEGHGVPYLGLRGRVEWREFSLDVDWLISTGISFGGEMDEALNDIEVLGRYHFDAQDIALRAGYRWMEIDTDGDEDGLRFSTNSAVEGFVLGVEFAF